MFLIFVSFFVCAGVDARSEKLQTIYERGKIIVGVKADYPPWGFYNSEGEIVGMEPDLARDVSDRLGVDLELVAVTASNRISKLEDGSIDLLIATMGDTEARRKQTGVISPSYYASGASILVPEDSKLNRWSDLYGQPVCLAKNAYFNRELQTRFLLEVNEYEGTRDNLVALRIGQCIGWIFDDTAITNVLLDDQWQGFKMPLDPIMVTPWTIAVPKSEEHSEYALFISDTIIDWLREGMLLELEAAWHIPESRFLLERNGVWAEKQKDGSYKCQRESDLSLPVRCLFKKSISVVDTVKQNFLSSIGIDFPPSYDSISRTALIKGVSLTFLLSLMSIVGSLTFGIIVGVIIFKTSSRWKWPIVGINNLFRMTPPLLNMYILFFGIGGLLAVNFGWKINAIVVAVLVFSSYAGSSNALLIKAALEEEYLRHPRTRFKKNFAAAFLNAFEGINANSINIVKAVGIASMIAVPELISAANNIIAEFGTKTEMMTFLLVFYFMVVYLFIFLLGRLQLLVVGKKK